MKKCNANVVIDSTFTKDMVIDKALSLKGDDGSIGIAYVISGNKMIVADSDGNSREDSLANWPLARSQERVVTTIDFTIEADDAYETINDAIDVATYIGNNLLGIDGRIYIVRLVDNKFGTSGMIVLPSVFITSKYVENVARVVVGDADNGADIAPAELSKLWTAVSNDGMAI